MNTCGIGFLVPSAASLATLPFDSLAEARHDYLTLRVLPAGKPSGYYERFMIARMPLEGMRSVFDQRVAAFEAQLLEIFDGIVIPPPARLALVDMLYNMGTKRFRIGFPRLQAAVRAGDWEGVARESHRQKVQDRRNAVTAALFRECLQTISV